MEESIASTPWGFTPTVYICEACDRAFILPSTVVPGRCPQCYQNATGKTTLVPYTPPESEGWLRENTVPELALPNRLFQAEIDDAINHFAARIPYPPVDLAPATLYARQQVVFLPTWLVDSQVNANWKAEAGYNYQVVSHQERYDSGAWRSREVQEQRLRWEPRLGRLNRSYTNIFAPAIDEAPKIEEAIGRIDTAEAQPYHATMIENAVVRLPDRAPQDAWNDAQAALKSSAGEDCRLAANADHFRLFSWEPEFHDKNWTLLLTPLVTTYYLDDEKKVHPVWINAQTGQISGVRRASMARARRTAGWTLVVAAAVFLLGMLSMLAGAIAPPFAALGVFGLGIALALVISAMVPVIRVWNFNQSS